MNKLYKSAKKNFPKILAKSVKGEKGKDKDDIKAEKGKAKKHMEDISLDSSSSSDAKKPIPKNGQSPGNKRTESGEKSPRPSGNPMGSPRKSISKTKTSKPEIATNSPTPAQERELSEVFSRLEEVRNDLPFDQLITLFASEFKASHRGFPDDVLSCYISRGIDDHNKSNGENVPKKYALAAVKKNALQVPESPTEPGKYEKKKAKNYSPETQGAPKKFAVSGEPNVSQKGEWNSKNIINIGPLNLNKVSENFDLNLSPRGQHPQVSISPLSSPGLNPYPYPQAIGLNPISQPLQPHQYQQYQQGMQYPQFGGSDNAPNTDLYLYDRILNDASNQ